MGKRTCMDKYRSKIRKFHGNQLTEAGDQNLECTIHVFFYKKLGSAPSTKSFLISHENFAIIVLKVS